jgi:hypothetical protein
MKNQLITIILTGLILASGCAEEPKTGTNDAPIMNEIDSEWEESLGEMDIGNVIPEEIQQYTVYRTQEECETAENCECAFVMCDYIPEGESPDMCEGLTGWVCSSWHVQDPTTQTEQEIESDWLEETELDIGEMY